MAELLTLNSSLQQFWNAIKARYATKGDVGKVSSFAYGESSTAAGTASKTVALQGVGDWELKNGAIIAVKMNADNTAAATKFTVTWGEGTSAGTTSAITVKYKGSAITTATAIYGGSTKVQLYCYYDNAFHWIMRDSRVELGYYDATNGKFYLSRSGSAGSYTYSTEITPKVEGSLFVDIATSKLYVYNNSSFTQSGSTVSGGYDNETDPYVYLTIDGVDTVLLNRTQAQELVNLSDYYTKTQVDGLISGIHQFTYLVMPDRSIITTTPTAENMYIIYLLPISGASSPNTKDEYIVTRSGTEGNYTYAWEMIGTTETDLSGYVPTSRKVNGHALTSDVTVTASDIGVASGAQVNVLEGVIGYDNQGLPIDGNKKVTLPEVPSTKVKLGSAEGNVNLEEYLADVLTKGDAVITVDYDKYTSTNTSGTNKITYKKTSTGTATQVIDMNDFAVTQSQLDTILNS